MRGRELERYLQLLAGTDPGERLLEIRYRHGDGMRQRFTPAREFGQGAGVIRSLGRLTDVYVGVLLRDRRSGGRDAVSRSHLVFAELDAPSARDAPTPWLRPPSAIIASGSPGHAHVYWRLRDQIGLDELEAANRRLAHGLQADMACVDAARILRLLSVGRAARVGVSPARSFADASVRVHGGWR